MVLGEEKAFIKEKSHRKHVVHGETAREETPKHATIHPAPAPTSTRYWLTPASIQKAMEFLIYVGHT